MVLEGLVKSYQDLLKDGDVRSNELPFVRDPLYVFVAGIAYLVMVIVGPRLMKNREAFQLRGVLIGYNFLSVALSIYMMWEFFRCSFLNPDFNLFCQSLDENDRAPMTMGLVHAHWLYFLSKFIEFFDTLFFVLRKKNNQISFLHVYHHCSMLYLQWMLIKYVPGGASYFGPLCNCFIHTLMYTYYMLSAFGPHMQKYLWWKKYLTRMQMYQFVLIFLYCSNALTYKETEGNTPTALFFYRVHWLYMISLFWLFNHFYQNAYNKTGKSEEKCKEN